ncbi:MAG: ABC-type transport auxiliary lipoprotein family protein [Thiobacillaceae bacterium]
MRIPLQIVKHCSDKLGRAGSALIMALALSGCINLGLGNKEAPAVTNYVLEDLGRAEVVHTSKPLTLVVLDTQVTSFYDTDSMAYSDGAGTRSYYQYARWTERPGKRMTDLLTLRLDKEDLFKAAVGDGLVKGDWLLETELLEFYHDASPAPGKARITLRADVVDLTSHTLIGRKLFSASEDLASFDAAGAHQGFNRASTRLINELMDWLASLSRG